MFEFSVLEIEYEYHKYHLYHIYTSIWRSMSNNEQVFVWRWKLSPSRGNRNWMKARKI